MNVDGRERPTPPLSKVLLAVGARGVGIGTLVYWLAALQDDTGDDHAVGPFHVGVLPLVAVGVVGLSLGLVGYWATRRWSAAARLSGVQLRLGAWFGAGMALTAAAWRELTVGVGGANIGAGLWVIATGTFWLTFLVAASLAGWRHRRRSVKSGPT